MESGSNNPGNGSGGAGSSAVDARLSELDGKLAAALGEIERLKDVQAIRDIQVLAGRGADWRDWAVLGERMWPEAYMDHGFIKGFVADMPPSNPEEILAQSGVVDQLHFITNQTIDFTDSSHAHTESYFMCVSRFDSKGRDSHECNVVIGRYLDDMEKRNGEWRVIKHLAIVDSQWTIDAREKMVDGNAIAPNTGHMYRKDHEVYWKSKPGI